MKDRNKAQAHTQKIKKKYHYLMIDDKGQIVETFRSSTAASTNKSRLEKIYGDLTIKKELVLDIQI